MQSVISYEKTTQQCQHAKLHEPPTTNLNPYFYCKKTKPLSKSIWVPRAITEDQVFKVRKEIQQSLGHDRQLPWCRLCMGAALC